MIDTYDVQLVNGTEIPGGLELNCIFAEGSQAQSCILTICRMESEVEESCKNISISKGKNSESGQVNNLLPGLYTVRQVAEVESNGQLTIHRKKNVLEFTVTEIPLSSTKSGLISLKLLCWLI